MNKKKKRKKTAPASQKHGRPTLLEFYGSYQAEAKQQFGTNVEIDPELKISPLPDWAKKTVTQLGKTIMKPVFKLRPTGKSTCQDFGKIIGILNRQITFYREDMWTIMEREGWDKISDEDWEKIQPRDQARAHVVKNIGRPVADTETLEDLAAELYELRIGQMEQMRTRALQTMTQRSAKENSLFYKGMAQGYDMFMNEDGKFCGDRGRTEIYLELISSLHEIEKMRRMLPARNDSDLFEHLKPWYQFPNDRKAGMSWMRDVCDDISLYMVGKRGRRAGSRRAPVF